MASRKNDEQLERRLTRISTGLSYVVVLRFTRRVVPRLRLGLGCIGNRVPKFLYFLGVRIFMCPFSPDGADIARLQAWLRVVLGRPRKLFFELAEIAVSNCK